MEPVRKFKIIVNSKECGTCSGPTPSAVAKKVVKKLCGTSSKVVKFSLKECKRGCEGECGPYQGRMEKLDKPYTRAGKKITHRVVCGKVRKMRGGALSERHFIKNDGEGAFKIDRLIGLEPYIFFNPKDGMYQNVIYCDSLIGGEVVILDNNKSKISDDKFNDEKFRVLLESLDIYLKNTTTKSQFKRIKAYLNRIISKYNNSFSNETVTGPVHVRNNGNGSAQENVRNNGPVHVRNNGNGSAQENVRNNGCIKKYSHDYQFSGIRNGISYNTNKLFRGNCKLYSYNPEKEEYELLLTELDYLVNDNKSKSITYSGVFQLSDNPDRLLIKAGSTMIPISDIDYYLYCINEKCRNTFDYTKKIYYMKKTIIDEYKKNYKYEKVYISNRYIECPCWIIFKK